MWGKLFREKNLKESDQQQREKSLSVYIGVCM